MYKDSQFYYLSEKPIEDNNAGSKARIDIENIIERTGLQPLEYLEAVKFDSYLQKLKYKASPSYLLKLYHLLRVQSYNLILQYPFYYDFITNKCLYKFAKSNKTILIVHDVDALRNFANMQLNKEIDFFNNVKILLVHNHKMLLALQKLGVTTPMVELELFDYLLAGSKHMHIRKLTNDISFAGNLSKSHFLQNPEIQKLNLDFYLYGPNFFKDSSPWTNIYYQGSFPPNEIPYRLEESFGLIWDGDSVQTCSGAFGKYMRYNNPHKLSLYISACLPVITWKQAAIADFVNKHQIGFCVDSLYEIKDKIDSLTEADYQKYLDNLKDLQKKVITGYFTKRAIQRAIEIANE